MYQLFVESVPHVAQLDLVEQWPSGAALTLFPLKGWKLALIVCYEVEFPEVVRAAALHGADLVLVPTALSSEWPQVARAVVPTRAFENGLFLTYANHAGVDQGYEFLGESCIMGPDGRALSTPQFISSMLSSRMPPQKPLHVSVFQSACADAAPAELIAALDAALDDPAARGTDLLLAPELFLGGYRAGPRIAAIAESRDGPFARAVAGIARKRGVAIAYGYPERDGAAIYNAAAVIGADGGLIAHHRKMRLPGAYEKQWFETGTALTLFMLNGWRVAPIVCYEVEFPEVVRAAARHGADLVLVPTALSSEWPQVARAVVPTRAFENGLFLAYANHAGVDQGYEFLGESCIAGPDGHDLARAAAFPCVIGATLDPSAIARARARIPFLSDSMGLEELPAK